MAKIKMWKLPPVIKVLEALGAVVEERVHEKADGRATVISSDRTKTYIVEWNAGENIISSNDNGSYWQGYLGYPAIAYLMTKGELSYDEEIARSFKSIKWKKLNTKFRDHEKVVKYLEGLEGIDMVRAGNFAGKVLNEITSRRFSRPGKLPFPPRSPHK